MEWEYTVCQNMRQWIALWKAGNKVKQRIICISKSIFDNAAHARPDNAFDYVICNDAFEFLTKGLGLKFGNLNVRENDIPYWERLAANVDVTNFDFGIFVNQRFNSFALNDEKDFIHAWFDNQDDFSRWLLKSYYLLKYEDQTYLNRVLMNCHSQSTSELFSCLLYTSDAADEL